MQKSDNCSLHVKNNTNESNNLQALLHIFLSDWVLCVKWTCKWIIKIHSIHLYIIFLKFFHFYPYTDKIYPDFLDDRKKSSFIILKIHYSREKIHYSVEQKMLKRTIRPQALFLTKWRVTQSNRLPSGCGWLTEEWRERGICDWVFKSGGLVGNKRTAY